jgi:hypothetical protein
MTTKRMAALAVVIDAVGGCTTLSRTIPGPGRGLQWPVYEMGTIEATASDECATMDRSAKYVTSECTNIECIIRRFDFTCEVTSPVQENGR